MADRKRAFRRPSPPAPRSPPVPMTELFHRIKVFVYRIKDDRPDYLLLQRDHGVESSWGPVQGTIHFGEQLETAAQREVHEDIGLARPLDLIDLEMPARWVLGDEEVIEWHYAFQALPDCDRRLQLAPNWRDARWSDFGKAFPELALEVDRAAILRLHSLLNAA